MPPRTIVIEPVLNGWNCQVGCQRVVFTDKRTMLNNLSEYYDDPEAVEKRFTERAVNKMKSDPPHACCESTVSHQISPTTGPRY